MRRRLFNILSALSLALCLGSAVLWARSYFWCDVGMSTRMVALDPTSDELEVYFLFSGRGGVTMGWSARRYTAATAEEMDQRRREKTGYIRDGRFHSSWRTDRGPLRYGGPTSGPDHRAFGFGFSHANSVAVRGWDVLFPYAAVVAITAFCPAIVFGRRWRAVRRLRRGCCATCGYDLRASKECCPECGTAIPVQAQAASGRT